VKQDFERLEFVGNVCECVVCGYFKKEKSETARNGWNLKGII
jgi:Zn ribbon nucleic-acid-binding protein